MQEVNIQTQLGGSQPVRVSTVSYRGEKLDIRHMYTDKSTGELRHTKRGIRIDIHEAEALVAAIEQVLERVNGNK